MHKNSIKRIALYCSSESKQASVNQNTTSVNQNTESKLWYHTDIRNPVYISDGLRSNNRTTNQRPLRKNASGRTIAPLKKRPLSRYGRRSGFIIGSSGQTPDDPRWVDGLTHCTGVRGIDVFKLSATFDSSPRVTPWHLHWNVTRFLQFFLMVAISCFKIFLQSEKFCIYSIRNFKFLSTRFLPLILPPCTKCASTVTCS